VTRQLQYNLLPIILSCFERSVIFSPLALQQQVAPHFRSKHNIISVGQKKKKISPFAHTHREKKSNKVAKQQ
jgi:hypothetical protein